MVQSILCKN